MPLTLLIVVCWMVAAAIVSAYMTWIFVFHRRPGVSLWSTLWYPWPGGDPSLLTETGVRYRKYAVWAMVVLVIVIVGLALVPFSSATQS